MHRQLRLFTRFVVAFLIVVASASACRNQRDANQNDGNENTGLSREGAYTPVTKYDPARDPRVDVQQAVAEAHRTGKRVLLVLGGDWCVWCHIMDAFFKEQPALLTTREERFITVKVNVSEENENKAFLSPYPKVPGYPHIFVLDSDGKLLHSQDTAELESGKSYDLEKFSTFLNKWTTGNTL